MQLACLALVSFAAVVGAGCGDDDATTSADSATGTTPATTATATTTQTAAGEFTPERDAMAQVDAILAPPPIVDRPEELAQAVADAITPAGEGEGATVTVTTAEEGEPTVILIEVRGLADDSVAGYDLRLTLDPDDTLGWAVTSATRRDLCSRGVSGELCT